MPKPEGGYDVVAPCSSCYIIMIKVNHEIKENPKLLDEVNACLLEGGLRYNGNLMCVIFKMCCLMTSVSTRLRKGWLNL